MVDQLLVNLKMINRFQMNVLENFEEIIIEDPVDKIIRQIRNLIISGQLKPGDKLPSERKLMEKMGVGRTNIRDAIKKLEFYGILRTLPQSGTVVTGIDIAALEGLISNVLKLETPDFFSLVETRVFLETQATRLAAIRRTDENLKEVRKAFEAYSMKVLAKTPGVNEDFLFHLKIAEASQNAVLKSLLLIIIPDILSTYRKLNVCSGGSFYKSLQEHQDILGAIQTQDVELAGSLMENHLKEVLEFSLRLKNENKLNI